MNIDDIKVNCYYGESHDAEFSYHCIDVQECDVRYFLMRKMVDGGYALVRNSPYTTRKLGFSSMMSVKMNVRESDYEIIVDGYRKRGSSKCIYKRG